MEMKTKTSNNQPDLSIASSMLAAQPELGEASTEEDKLWVFVYVSENLEGCTKLFRQQESCEIFAVEYMAKVYGYTPTGNLSQDLTALERMWLNNGEDDCWYTSECTVLD